MPLVHDQEHHDRIIEISVGLMLDEPPVGIPYHIPWAEHLPSLQELGLPLAARPCHPLAHPLANRRPFGIAKRARSAKFIEIT